MTIPHILPTDTLPLRLPLSAYSYSIAQSRTPAQWTHLSKRTDLFFVLDVIKDQEVMQIIQGSEVLHTVAFETLMNDTKRNQPRALDHKARTIVVMLNRPSMAIRYRQDNGKLFRFQVKFAKESNFDRILEALEPLQLPIQSKTQSSQQDDSRLHILGSSNYLNAALSDSNITSAAFLSLSPSKATNLPLTIEGSKESVLTDSIIENISVQRQTQALGLPAADPGLGSPPRIGTSNGRLESHGQVNYESEMPAPRATTSDGRLELISPMAMDSQTTQQDTLAMMPPKRVLPFLERVSKANRSGTTDDAATSNKKPALSTTVERSTKRRRVDNSDPHVSSEESAKRPSGSASKVPKESQLPKTSNIVLSRVGKRMAQTDVATNLNARPPTIGSSSNAKGTSNGPEVNAPWKGESQLDEDDKMMEYLLEQFSGRAAEVIDATRAPITDFSAYAKIPEKKRLEAMEQYMIAAILDDGFLKVMEDVEVCWKRIGFET